MGMCDFGQLGIGRTTEQPLVWPQLVSTLDKIRVIKVVAGMDHTAALGSLGQVYTWGLGGYGQTGIGRADNQMLATPTLVPNIPPLYKLFAGADHTGGVDGTLLRRVFHFLVQISFTMMSCSGIFSVPDSCF